MRENRPYGSEGGVAKSHPDPYPIHEFHNCRAENQIGAIRLTPIAPYARHRCKFAATKASSWRSG